jgi:hypothetical protein
VSSDPIEEDNPIEEILLTGFPNPDRTGCPQPEIIEALGNGNLTREHEAWGHVWRCSPCFRHFKTIRDARWTREKERRSKRRLMITVAAVAAVLVVSVVGFRDKIGTGRIEGDAIMNFATSGNRGISDSAVPLNPEVQSYQRQRLLLTVNLPPGSDDGDYELEILPGNGGAPLAHVTGRASIGNGLTMFRAQLDLSKVTPGLYKARVRKLSPPSSGLPDGSWRSLTIHVR